MTAGWISRSSLVVATVALCIPANLAHTDIPPSEAREMILAGGVVVLDVREYFEFCGSHEHIEDAVSLPWSSGVLQSRFDELDADVPVIVVCASGSRSHLAALFLDGCGFTQVYDMLGGMSAWTWETEPCDAQPSVLVHAGPSGSVVNWTPVPGAQDYDLLSGLLSNVTAQGAFIDLGPADCLAVGSPYTYRTVPDVPLPGSVHFYLSRQVGGSWGQSSQEQERVPQFCD